MSANAGYATLQIIPTTKGILGNLKGELDGPLSDAGDKAGDSTAKSFGAKFKSAIGTVAKAGAVAFGAAFAGAVKLGKDSLGAATELGDVMSKVDTIFGESSVTIQDWSKGAAKAFGLSRTEALNAVGTFGNMYTQLGIGTGEAGKMSMAMTQLAGDFTSFHGGSTVDAIDAMTAAFRGEYDAVQRFVPTINAAAVEQRALADTHKKSAKELTAGEKALATYALLTEGAGAAAGDFARTADSAANQQRSLSAVWKDAQASIGQALLPAMQAVIPIVQRVAEWLGDKLPGAIEWARKAWDFFVGGLTGEFTNEGSGVLLFMNKLGMFVGDLVDKFKRAWPTIKQVVGAVFDWLTGTAWPAVQIVFRAIVDGVTWVVNWFRDHWSQIQAVVGAVVDWLTGTAWPAVQAVWDGIVAGVSLLVGYIREHWDAIKQVIDSVWGAIKVIVETAITVVKTTIETTVAVIRGIWEQWGTQIKAFAESVWNGIQSVIEGVINVIRGIILAVTSLIQGDWSSFWDGIKSVVSGAWDIIKGIVEAAVGALKLALQVAWDGIKAATVAVWQSIQNLAGILWDGIKTAIMTPINAAKDALQTAWDLIKSAATTVWDGIQRAIGGPVNVIRGIIDGIRSTIEGVIDAFRRMKNMLTGWATTDGFNLRDMVGNQGTFTGGSAAGGPVPRGWRLVGEEGPELVNMRGTEFVYTAAQTRQMLAGGGGGFPSEFTLIVEGEPLRARVSEYHQQLRQELLAGRR